MERSSFHSDLFNLHLWDCIPAIQDGETLFSWCCIYHRVSGLSCASKTSKRLFESETSGFVRDFPSRIDNFIQVTDGQLGDANHIIREHTLYRLYSRFRPAKTTLKIRSMMRGNYGDRLKFILGLPGSRANSSHPLKFCRKCVEEEILESGLARWWINLQWPTVWVCARHNQLLDYAAAAPSGPKKFTWILPSDLEPSEIISLDEDLSSRVADLLKLAKLTLTVADNDLCYSPESLRLVFLNAIKDRGWVTPVGCVKYATLRDEFQKQCGDLIRLPGMDFISSVNHEDFGFLSAILYAKTRFLHPSKYLLLINFLFNDFNSFKVIHDKYSTKQYKSEEVLQSILDPEREQREKEMYRLVVIEGVCLNQVAQFFDISRSHVFAWARRNNIPYKHRPKIKTEQLELALKKLIEKGASQQEISTKLGVRRQWLTAYFERHPSLRVFWRKQNLATNISLRREKFLDFLNAHRGVPLSKLRYLPNNGYRWLLRHDSQWLLDNLPLM